MDTHAIIADVAGQYDALMRLMVRIPKHLKVISVGDLMDRGPKSFEVMEFFYNNPQYIVLNSNHAHLMLDYLTMGHYYPSGCWYSNGGGATVRSFEKNGCNLEDETEAQKWIDWMKSHPNTYETPNLFVSHAFFANWMFAKGLGPDNYGGYAIEESILWNRTPPKPMDNKYQVCGHNSQFGLRTWHDDDGNPYATCIDDSAKGLLTAILMPSLTVIQEKY